MARRSHPFPYRTRKLSFSAPMVVGTRVPVRVGRCQAKTEIFVSVFFNPLFKDWEKFLLSSNTDGVMIGKSL
jgi:hypothetical protein